MRYFLFILLAGLLGACSDEGELNGAVGTDSLELSKKELKLSNVATSSTVDITATGEWLATVVEPATNDAEQAWLTLSKSNGTGNDELRLFVAENTDGAKRMGKVKVTMAGAGSTLEQEIAIEQLGSDPDILFEFTSEPVSFRGAEVELKVVANMEWKMDIDEQCDWIEVVEETPVTRNFSEQILKLKVALNTGNARTTELVFSTVGEYKLQRVLKVMQEAVNGVAAIEQDEYTIPYKCRTLVIPFTQEGDEPVDNFDAIPSEAWITHNKRESTSNEIVLTIADNEDFLPRTSTVRILDKTITIFQYGKPDTSIGDDKSVEALAFPGAEGGGRFTTGGRGGELYKVTNLSDYGENEAPIKGSLRYGIEQVQGPRTIVFDVDGIIELKQGIYLVNHPDLSIIGQTAPGEGITLKNYNFSFNISNDPSKGAGSEINAIVRFLRIRPGDACPDYTEDGIGGRYFKDGIIDHVTAGWSVDETLTFYGVQNFTAQWCIASESLNLSNHAKGAHGYGAMFSGDNTTFHHILLAHHGSRCPRISDLSAVDDPERPRQPFDYCGYFDVRNNVYYNWSESGFGSYGGKLATFNLTNCYYKPGPATGTGYKSYRVLSTDPTARAYIDGNYVEGNSKVTSDNWTDGVWAQFDKSLVEQGVSDEEKQAMKMADYQPFSKVTSHTAQVAYERVLDYAGASLHRDAIDQRVIGEVRAGSAPYKGSVMSYWDEKGNFVSLNDSDKKPGIIDTPSDAAGGYVEMKKGYLWPDSDNDGIPDIWELAYGLNPEDPSDANVISSSVDPNGRYSNLEVYFHNLVQHIVYYQNQGGQPMERK